MTSQDTEALKALVAACEKEFCSPATEGGELVSADDESVMGPGECAITFGKIRASRAALERMLASQGEQREAQGEVNNGIKQLVDKFLSWKLPASVCPDLCTNVSKATYPGESIGTNLLTAAEAEEMIRYLGLYPCPCHPAVKQTMRSHEVELRCSHLNGCNNIMDELKEHTNAAQGEDAYLRIYPCDARKILESVSPPLAESVGKKDG